MPKFKTKPQRRVQRRADTARKAPDPDTYPRKRVARSTDVLTFTDGIPRKESEANVLAAARLIMKGHPGYRMPRSELIKALPGVLAGVKDYNGYVCWLVQKGYLVTVGGRA